MCTSVASRVHGHDRRAVLELAVVGEDDVQHGRGELGREAGEVLDRAADPVVAERDLALELAEVGHVDGQRVGRVGVELADVVQQRAGDRDVAVDARERGRDRRDAPARRRASARAARGGRPGGSAWRPGASRNGGQVGESGPSSGRAARAGAGPGPWRSARAGRPPSRRPRAAARRAGRRGRTRPGRAARSARSVIWAP